MRMEAREERSLNMYLLALSLVLDISPFCYFYPYSERRQKECSLSFLDGGGGATTVIDDRCEIQNFSSI